VSGTPGPSPALGHREHSGRSSGNGHTTPTGRSDSDNDRAPAAVAGYHAERRLQQQGSSGSSEHNIAELETTTAAATDAAGS
jgi:hypothetical protein